MGGKQTCPKSTAYPAQTKHVEVLLAFDLMVPASTDSKRIDGSSSVRMLGKRSKSFCTALAAKLDRI